MSDQFPMVDVVGVKTLAGHKLRLRFSDGAEGDCDLSSVVRAGGEMVLPLVSPEYFARVFVEAGSPTWPNGFDLDPVNLYMEMKAARALKHSAPV